MNRLTDFSAWSPSDVIGTLGLLITLYGILNRRVRVPVVAFFKSQHETKEGVVQLNGSMEKAVKWQVEHDAKDDKRFDKLDRNVAALKTTRRLKAKAE